MKNLQTKILLAILSATFAFKLFAQVQTLPDKKPQCVFFGGNKKISVVFYNQNSQNFEGQIRIRIFQTTSATAVLLNEIAWKNLQALPGQTMMESAQLDFPAVRAETKFLVQWLENSNRVLGVTEVLVYPTNLLLELQPLAGDKAIGVYDSQNQLKPLLKNLRIDFEDLGEIGVTNFSGRLAIVGSFQSKSQMPDDLPEQIKMLAKKNVAIVWIQPPEKSNKLKPSYYSVPEKQIAVVVVQPDLVSDLAENPQSQLNLIHLCKLALNPQPPTLPNFRRDE